MTTTFYILSDLNTLKMYSIYWLPFKEFMDHLHFYIVFKITF